MNHLSLILCVVCILTGFLGVSHAHAYLDPASGSMLLQLLLGGTAGVAMIAKMYWSRIKQFFGRGSSAIFTPKTDKTEK